MCPFRPWRRSRAVAGGTDHCRPLDIAEARQKVIKAGGHKAALTQAEAEHAASAPEPKPRCKTKAKKEPVDTPSPVTVTVSPDEVAELAAFRAKREAEREKVRTRVAEWRRKRTARLKELEGK